MLKGILFVIAIIVTFDIGKKLIEDWDDEQAAGAKGNARQVEKELIGKPVDNDSAPVQIGLSLPDDLLEDELSADNAETPEATTMSESVQAFRPREKKSSLKAKPIMTFNKEDIESSSVEGAKIDFKIKVD